MQPFGASPQEPVLTEAAGAALQRISNFSFWCFPQQGLSRVIAAGSAAKHGNQCRAPCQVPCA